MKWGWHAACRWRFVWCYVSRYVENPPNTHVPRGLPCSAHLAVDNDPEMPTWQAHGAPICKPGTHICETSANVAINKRPLQVSHAQCLVSPPAVPGARAAPSPHGAAPTSGAGAGTQSSSGSGKTIEAALRGAGLTDCLKLLEAAGGGRRAASANTVATLFCPTNKVGGGVCAGYAAPQLWRFANTIVPVVTRGTSGC